MRTEDIANGSPAVRARGLRKTFDDAVALDSVDLDIAAGQVHGVAGPAGAGKTTLLSLLLGLATADSGSLEILGTTVAVPDTVTGFLGDPGLCPSLTARGNLSALALLRGIGRPAASVEDVLAQAGLTGAADDMVRGFSPGMRQRLGLAAALLIRPRLLVLDEPAAGPGPAGLPRVHGTLTRLAADGVTVVLSSRRADDLAAVCSEITLLEAGRVIPSNRREESWHAGNTPTRDPHDHGRHGRGRPRRHRGRARRRPDHVPGQRPGRHHHQAGPDRLR